MYSTQLYLYQQITQVLAIDTVDGPSFSYRYNPVYAKVLTINKGIDNVLLFEFINQNEKPVDITGSNFIFRVIDTEGITVLLEQPMVILNAATGRAKVTLMASQLLEILAQPAYYSITRASGNLVEPDHRRYFEPCPRRRVNRNGIRLGAAYRRDVCDHHIHAPVIVCGNHKSRSPFGGGHIGKREIGQNDGSEGNGHVR